MVTRMKFARALMSIVIPAVLASQELAAGTSTNDIDRVFEVGKEGEVCSVFTNAPYVMRQIANMQKDEKMKSLSRYYMVRLVSFDVTTNMINAAACLREKGNMIESAYDAFSWFWGEGDVRNLLEHVSSMNSCSTNHIGSLMESAKDEDEKLGFRRQLPGRRRAYSGTPSPNVGKVIAERRRLREWNNAVTHYRDRLVQLARRRLDEMWKSIPDSERTKMIDMFLFPYVRLPVGGNDEN